MRTAEIVVGAGLLLGPLVYALFLSAPEAATPVVVVDGGACEVSTPPLEPEIVVVGMCEEHDVAEPEPEPAPEPALAPLPDGHGEFVFVVDLPGFHQPIPGKAKTAGMRPKNSVSIAEYECDVNQPPHARPGDTGLGSRKGR
jgi:hypothetical protein